MREAPVFSFGLLRLLIFTAALGATCGASKLVEPPNSIGVWMAGGAISLLALLVQRKHMPSVLRVLMATICVFLACVAISRFDALLAGIAAFVLLVGVLAALDWLR